MKIKTKLVLGVGLLFAMIVVLTAISTTYINRLSDDSKNILTDNYNTIAYCRHMLIDFNDGIGAPRHKKTFSRILKNKQLLLPK